MRKAVIDIGTNSVKLLVADCRDGGIEAVLETSRQTRLGRGFYQSRRLQPEAIHRTATTVDDFARRALEGGSTQLRIIATSAVRDAANAAEFVEAVRSASGREVEIITGRQEAAWAFHGVLTHPGLAGHPLLIADVGGGSTEFILGHDGALLFDDSVELGTVRLLESVTCSDPPAPAELKAVREQLGAFLEQHLVEPLAKARDALATDRPGESTLLVGTGGTATLLARLHLGLDRYDRDLIEQVVLSRANLTDHVETLWGLPAEKRAELPGLPAEKTDVILMGAVIFEAIMRTFDYDELRPSMRGLRYGVLADDMGRADERSTASPGAGAPATDALG